MRSQREKGSMRPAAFTSESAYSRFEWKKEERHAGYGIPDGEGSSVF